MGEVVAQALIDLVDWRRRVGIPWDLFLGHRHKLHQGGQWRLGPGKPVTDFLRTSGHMDAGDHGRVGNTVDRPGPTIVESSLRSTSSQTTVGQALAAPTALVDAGVFAVVVMALVRRPSRSAGRGGELGSPEPGYQPSPGVG